MPPKTKYTREQIVEAAIRYVRIYGAEELSARTLGRSIGCSPQPIFCCFSGREEGWDAVDKAAYDLYLGYLQREMESGRWTAYKSFGVGYVRFAMEEPRLFQYLFLRDRSDEIPSEAPDWKASLQMIAEANGFSEEEAEELHLNMWVCVHGIATMAATDFLKMEWEQISLLMSNAYLGTRDQILKRRKEHGGN